MTNHETGQMARTAWKYATWSAAGVIYIDPMQAHIDTRELCIGSVKPYTGPEQVCIDPVQGYRDPMQAASPLCKPAFPVCKLASIESKLPRGRGRLASGQCDLQTPDVSPHHPEVIV